MCCVVSCYVSNVVASVDSITTLFVVSRRLALIVLLGTQTTFVANFLFRVLTLIFYKKKRVLTLIEILYDFQTLIFIFPFTQMAKHHKIRESHYTHTTKSYNYNIRTVAHLVSTTHYLSDNNKK